MFLPLVLLSLATGVLSDIPFIDDGTHTSLDNAFVFSDEIYARLLAINFNCSSPSIYAEIDVKNSTQVPLYVGIPDIPDLHDFKPTFWVFGKTVEPSDTYTDSTSDSEFTIPDGYTGYKVDTSEDGVFQPYDEEGAKFVILLNVTVNISDVAPIYVVAENPGQKNTRMWIWLGEEDSDADVSQETYDEALAWFNSDTYTATTCANQSAPSSISSYEAGASNLNFGSAALALLAAPLAFLI